MRFFYGINNNYKDVTDIIIQKFSLDSNAVFLPKSDDVRCVAFNLPNYLPYIVKHIKVVDNNGNTRIIDDNEQYIINLNMEMRRNELRDYVKQNIGKMPENKLLDNMHNSIKIKDGSMEDEYPEQLMAMKYIKPHNKVLEIGGNIGRNSIIISSILDDESNLVVLESDPNIANSLRRNLASNGFAPHVESAALSKRQLIQRGWDTIPSDVVLDGWKKVNTIIYNELVKKYDVNFDTIVADCEGALYYILKDQPHILYDIKMLIMENDYKDASHKEFVDKLLTGAGFKRVYVRPGGWREYPKSSFEYDHIFYDNFFEVWSRI